MEFLAEHTDRFSGADLTEICQRAAKLAIREAIEREAERDRIRREAEERGEEPPMDDDFDPVPEILPRHFEDSMQSARRSVSDADLLKYASFAKNLQQQRNTMSGGASGPGVQNFSFPRRSGGDDPSGETNDEDEDLYG